MGYKFENNKFYNAAGQEVENIDDKIIAEGLATARALGLIKEKMLNFAD
jgi:hypothetical protein